MDVPTRPVAGFELHFESLFQPGRGYAFPCDDTGQVQLELMNERARDSYRRVRSLVGKEYAAPVRCKPGR